jgi:hypothetical protein
MQVDVYARIFFVGATITDKGRPNSREPEGAAALSTCFTQGILWVKSKPVAVRRSPRFRQHGSEPTRGQRDTEKIRKQSDELLRTNGARLVDAGMESESMI